MKIGGNEYNFRELAGTFGDLGTLIPSRNRRSWRNSAGSPLACAFPNLP
jgi:hypothetical protein